MIFLFPRWDIVNSLEGSSWDLNILVSKKSHRVGGLDIQSCGVVGVYLPTFFHFPTFTIKINQMYRLYR